VNKVEKVQEEVIYYRLGDAFLHEPSQRVEIIINTSDGLYLLSPDDLQTKNLYCHQDKIPSHQLEYHGGVFFGEYIYIGQKTLAIHEQKK